MSHPFKHFKTITHHRHVVIRHCFKAGIPLQGLRHDLSKYAPVEFFSGAKYYDGTRSPNEAERQALGFSYAWMHHKGRNRHHFEYWTDYNPVIRKTAPVKMPLKYVIEMFCDRVAACKTYMQKTYDDGAPLAYFKHGNAAALMHPETARLIEALLTMLRDEGEKSTFAYIKKLHRQKDY